MATDDETLRWRAAELGIKLREEDGVAKAVKLIEYYYSTFQKNGGRNLEGLLAREER